MLELNVIVPDEINSISLFSGAYVMIHNDSVQPMSFYEGYDVSSGFSTSFILERIVRTQMPKPYSECENIDSIYSYDSFYFKQSFKPNQTYRQTECMNMFVQEQLILNCGCYDIKYNNQGHDNPCDTLNEFKCVYLVFLDILSTEYKSKLKDKCPLECETVSYEVKQNFIKYPTESYVKGLQKSDKIKSIFGNQTNITLEFLREKILFLNFYYNDLKQIEITESPNLTWDVLISGIGGTLGLFLGVSVLSIFEFVEIFLQTLYILFSKNKTETST